MNLFENEICDNFWKRLFEKCHFYFDYEIGASLEDNKKYRVDYLKMNFVIIIKEAHNKRNIEGSTWKWNLWECLQTLVRNT